MKKVISYILLVLILTAGVMFGFAPVLSAQAAGETGPASLSVLSKAQLPPKSGISLLGNTKLPEPTSLTWDLNTNDLVRARWNPVDGADYYILRLYRVGSEDVVEIIVFTNSKNFTVNNFMGHDDGEYYFTVQAASDNPQVETSDVAKWPTG